MAMLPLLAARIVEADDDMGDLEYLAIKEHEGKLRSDEGFADVLGDMATLTANVGKDMYLATAKCMVRLLTETGINQWRVELKVNGNTIETAHGLFKGSGTNNNSNLTQDYEFKNIGHKVLAGEIIKLEVTQINTVQTQIEGEISCFEENTGVSPKSS